MIHSGTLRHSPDASHTQALSSSTLWQPCSHSARHPGTSAARDEGERRVRTEHRGGPVYISCSNNTYGRGTWVRQGAPQPRTSRPAGRQAPGAAVEACGAGPDARGKEHAQCRPPRHRAPPRQNA